MNYITIRDLCERLKVTRQCIYEWRGQGMPYYKLGRLVRFKLEEVEQWISENKQV